MAQRTELNEYRPDGTRNFIRLDDTVKILPSSPRKRDGFTGRVIKIVAIDGEVAEIDVVGPRGFRTIRPERVARMAQTRCGEKVDR